MAFPADKEKCDSPIAPCQMWGGWSPIHTGGVRCHCVL